MRFCSSRSSIGCGAYTVNACRSRSTSSPASASTSPPISTTAAIGESRDSCSRPEPRCLQNLLAEVGRSADDDPVGSVAAYGDTGLGRGPRPRIACSRKTAKAAAAVPLRESAARRRTENQGRKPGRSVIHSSRRRRARLHLAGKVAVDFHADADFAELRAGPGHGMSPRFLWCPRHCSPTTNGSYVGTATLAERSERRPDVRQFSERLRRTLIIYGCRGPTPTDRPAAAGWERP